MWRFTPKISWKSTRPGPLPAGGSERYAPYLPPLVAATSIHWEVMAILVEGSGKEFRQRFRALRIRDERGIFRRGNLRRVVVLAEAPRDRGHHVGRSEAIALQPRPRAGHQGLELRERGVRLADDAVEPRLVELLLRPLLLLVDDRHALVGRREGEADDVQGPAPRVELRGQQPPLLGQRRLDVIEDERRIHEHRSVAANERRRLHDGIHLAEFLEVAEHRQRPVLERDVHELQGDGAAPHIGRVEHADEDHAAQCKIKNMRKVDIFNHVMPLKFFERIGKRMREVPMLYDLDERFRVMDRFDEYQQVLSAGMPPIEALAGPKESPELARICNDGLAELCAKHPKRFPTS